MKKIYLFALLSAISFGTLLAQTSTPYFLSTFDRGYVPITDGTSLVSDQTWDDPNDNFNLGFEYSFFDRTTETASFGEHTGGTVELFLNETDSTLTSQAIVATILDLESRQDYFNEASPIVGKTESTTDGQVFKMEWQNAGFFDTNEEFDNKTDLQLWLYEADGSFEVHFGPSSFENYNAILTGENWNGFTLGYMEYQEDANNTSGEFYHVGGPDAPTLFLNTDIDFETIQSSEMLASYPDDGTVFRFSATPVSTRDVVINPELFKLTNTLATNQINWTLTENKGSAVQYWISSANGQVIEQGKTAQQQLVVGTLPTGLYQITLQLGNQAQTSRFFKQ